MKTLLTILSLLSAGSLPSAIAAELAGAHLPAGMNSMTAFGAFIISLVALTAFADYARPAPAPISAVGPCPAQSAIGGGPKKSAHPLAA
jgi:hypothetical protein